VRLPLTTSLTSGHTAAMTCWRANAGRMAGMTVVQDSAARPRGPYEDHIGPWTIPDLMALPENGIRYEVVDGALIVNPPPSLTHQGASFQLHTLLRAAARAAGASVTMWEAVGLQLPGEQLLIPDLTVVSAEGTRGRSKLVDPSTAVLVAEVVSPGSTTRDRSEKPYLYAQAGIPNFWRVELGEFRGRSEPSPVVLVHTLGDDGEYRLTHQAGAGSMLRVAEPFPIEFDPAELLAE
jgi:Uma2 family endonuclease